jgi:ABC-2 type transport system permease protein
MHSWRLVRYLRAIHSAALMTFRQNVFDMFIIFGILLQPLIIATLALWMIGDRVSEAIVFIVVGSGMTGLWTNLVFQSGNSITRERWTGTLELITATPTPMFVIIFGKNIANVFQSLSSMLFCYSFVSWIFGYQVSIEQPLVFILSLCLTVIAFVCFGMIIAPIFLLNPSVQRWQNSLEFPVYILCGFLFPIALLPNWTTPFSYILPPYWAARALHGASSGATPASDIAFSLIMLVIFSLVNLLISRILFRIMIRKVREEATLGLQ